MLKKNDAKLVKKNVSSIYFREKIEERQKTSANFEELAQKNRTFASVFSNHWTFGLQKRVADGCHRRFV
jgi:hypothetical protein